ncbi:SDR family oxidoreductase [Paenibacillus alginolyticus]|uniref:SDR family oxidoreductase n=1 Tax=Paenibacillus alginolyticus TaxID=59839 RepID=A0ABT4G9S9_9BACL|nr:SDR family oxidoreductase [Paenibacillus alginolyticus]MCY9669896.1 SDR family oxidoreductase [Paenibacillus alginolyticus]MCY9692940.1 SDR family oxidoreductase [Paenibacillus alginolyticus]MEC0144319.1 SDR family NAD(P)-dependent oxidoreductase [Paenibacillus alginolyticus]
MFEPQSLRGKTVAITGATSGIGKATALLLASQGANLLLGSRSAHSLSSLAWGFDTDVIGLPVDVSIEESVKGFVEGGIRKFGRIDALINCAGNGVFGSALDISVEDFDRMIAVNLKGTFLCCKHFGRHMVENRSGRILNVASIAGTTALAGCAGYSASKFGVVGLTKVLQTELRSSGVYLTSVLPGSVNTEFWDGMESHPDRDKMIPAETLAKHLVYLLCQPDGAVIDELTVMPSLGIL